VGEQAFGERLYVLARDRREEHEFEKFVVRQCVLAAFAQAFAQAFAVADMVRKLAPAGIG